MCGYYAFQSTYARGARVFVCYFVQQSGRFSHFAEKPGRLEKGVVSLNATELSGTQPVITVLFSEHPKALRAISGIKKRLLTLGSLAFSQHWPERAGEMMPGNFVEVNSKLMDKGLIL